MKKLSAIILAVLMVLAMAVSAAAYEPNEVMLVVFNSVDWGKAYSDPQVITENGEYTFKLDGFDFAMNQVMTIYIKDCNAETEAEVTSTFPAGTQIITKSLKINGEEVTLLTDLEGYPDEIAEGGSFDVCWWNEWATDYIDASSIFELNSVEATIEVIFPEAAAEEAPAEEEAPVDDVEAPADDVEAPATEPEVTEEETPAETGLALSLIPAAIAMAVVVLKRR